MLTLGEILRRTHANPVPEPPCVGADPDVPLSLEEQRLVAVWFRRLVRDTDRTTVGCLVPPHIIGRIATTFDGPPQ